MPFTIDGQWVPSKAVPTTSVKKPVKVRNRVNKLNQ